jgi:hypothetical protein
MSIRLDLSTSNDEYYYPITLTFDGQMYNRKYTSSYFLGSSTADYTSESKDIISIGNNAFTQQDPRITFIEILDNVTTIADNAFINSDPPILYTTITSYAYTYYQTKFPQTTENNNRINKLLFLNKIDIKKCTDINSTNSQTTKYAEYYNKKASLIPLNGEVSFNFLFNFTNSGFLNFYIYVIRNAEDTYTFRCQYLANSNSVSTITPSQTIQSTFYDIMLQILAALNVQVVVPYYEQLLDGYCQ